MKEHLFARICRTLGRFLLTIGTVLLVGSLFIILSPAAEQTAESPNIIYPIYAEVPSTSEASSVNNFALGLLGICLSIGILIALFLAMRHYNSQIRSIIAKIATIIHLDIHITELLLTTIIWGCVTIIAAFNFPIYAIFALCVLIINSLLFIFAWTSYGARKYTL